MPEEVKKFDVSNPSQSAAQPALPNGEPSFLASHSGGGVAAASGDGEGQTRKKYIDTMLRDDGWIEGKNWLNEYELPGMPNKSEVGFADYALFGDDGRILAVIEAKRTCVDVSKGRQQAKLYADLIEKKQGFRPVVFLSNGFETRIVDNQYPERKVARIYSKRDLEKWFNLQRMRSSLKNIMVDRNIAGRYYQEAAIKAVCDSFGEKNRRKALLVMATGSGKTRTVIALVKVLMDKGWIKKQQKDNIVQALTDKSLKDDLKIIVTIDDIDRLTKEEIIAVFQLVKNLADFPNTVYLLAFDYDIVTKALEEVHHA